MIKFYSEGDRILRTSPYNSIYQGEDMTDFRPWEKYAIANGKMVQNESFDEVLAIQKAKDDKYGRIENKTRELEDAPFTFENKQFPSDPRSREKYLTLYTIFKTSTLGPSVPIRMANNSINSLPSSKYQDFFDAAFNHVRDARLSGSTILAELAAAKDLEEIQDIEDDR